MRYLVVLMLMFSSAVSAAEKDFPGRSKYPHVPVIEKQELKAKMEQVVIVDTRSSLEFDTLRIKGAVNIPVASKTFIDEVKTLRSKQPAKTIVFYCNGRSCFKSYRSVDLSKRAGINQTVAYDAGMFEWAETYPEQAELLGKSPVSKSAIISANEYRKRLLTPGNFTEKMYSLGKKSLVLDVRDKYQRGAAGFFPGKEYWVSLDDRKKLQQYIDKARKENRTLFIYDEVGKQVRWVQYALQDADIKDYYFMDKGAKGYYASMMKDMGISTDRLQ